MNVHQRNCTSSPPKKSPLCTSPSRIYPLGGCSSWQQLLRGNDSCALMTLSSVGRSLQGCIYRKVYKMYLFLDRFVFKNTGVLFENDILQVGIKSEFTDGKGKWTDLFFLIIFWSFPRELIMSFFFFLILKQELLVYSMVIRRHRSLSIFPPLFTCLEILILISF